ncbi:putative DEAH-box ATP-dependent helicase like protein [Verticillium longisporum]|nr:putative DEAH-box ATP-dependent helicase like protein [Verticillium longisporum]
MKRNGTPPRQLRNFCDDNFLSYLTLTDISATRQQFYGALGEMGVAFDHETRGEAPASQGYASRIMLRALTASAFSPQIARIQFPDKKFANSMSGAVELDPEARAIKYFTEEQGRVFVHPSSTIFETSITIDDIVAVVDSGKVKETTYDAQNNMRKLEEMWASRAACKQRRGRAGRVQAGKCYKLYTRNLEMQMAERPEPEIRRVPLEQMCLSVRAMGMRDVAAFLGRSPTPPASTAVDGAIKMLRRMGALDGDELTALGQQLAMIPADLRCAKLMVVLVLQNIGPVGNPGMPEAGLIPIPRKLAARGVLDMLRVSDGRMSGTAGGTIVLHVSPEAADPESVLGIVRTGDIITCDVDRRVIRVELSDEEIQRRVREKKETLEREEAKEGAAPGPWTARKTIRGYRGLYMRSVNQAQQGADFDFLTAAGPRGGQE